MMARVRLDIGNDGTAGTFDQQGIPDVSGCGERAASRDRRSVERIGNRQAGAMSATGHDESSARARRRVDELAHRLDEIHAGLRSAAQDIARAKSNEREAKESARKAYIRAAEQSRAEHIKAASTHREQWGQIEPP